MGIGFVSLIVIAMIPMITGNLGQRVIGKRNTVGNDIPNIDYLDYAAKYDDYPVSKRIFFFFLEETRKIATQYIFFSIRVCVNTKDYWKLYFVLIQCRPIFELASHLREHFSEVKRSLKLENRVRELQNRVI